MALDEFKLQSGLTPLKFYRSNRNPLSTTFIMAVPETQAQAVHRSLWQYTHHHGCQIFHEYGNIRCLHFRFSQPKMGCQLPFFPSTMTFNEGIAFVRIIRSRQLLFNAFRWDFNTSPVDPNHHYASPRSLEKARCSRSIVLARESRGFLVWALLVPISRWMVWIKRIIENVTDRTA